jgi:hypothetical protein
MLRDEQFKSVVDYLVAPSTIVASFIGWLPAVAAGLGVLWYIIQIYDRIKYGPSQKKD